MKSNLVKLTVISIVVLASTVLLHSSAVSSTVPGANLTQDGGALFGQKCAVCHGKDGKGVSAWKSKGIPDFTNANWQRAHTDAQIAETIKNGKGRNMPPFNGKLSDSQISAVVGQVRAYGRH
jgi:cytochrome c6